VAGADLLNLETSQLIGPDSKAQHGSKKQSFPLERIKEALGSGAARCFCQVRPIQASSIPHVRAISYPWSDTRQSADARLESRELRRKGRAVEQAIETLIARFHRSPADIEIAQKLNIPLATYQQLLGELKGLEIGTLHGERSQQSDDEDLIFLPGRPRMILCFTTWMRRCGSA
jgi:hypothetical protein